MGNVCCQTDIEPSPLERDMIKIEEYEPAEKPENDEIIQNWFKENDSQRKQGQQQNGPKIMKHKYQERYYYGNWKDNVPEGRGFLYEPGHLFYDGQFKGGLPSGKSTVRFLDKKCQFQGNIKDGKADGEGTIDNLEEKFRFQGVWENSKPTRGTLTLYNDPNIATVEFEEFANGRGTISYKDNRKYIGQIDTEKIKPHGKGTVTFSVASSKTLYEGQWANGQMHGQGKLLWRDGSYYEGSYLNGKKQGEGKFVFASKNYYDGFWLNGKQDGVGILYDKDGSELKKGFWSEGTFKQRIPEEQWDNEKEKCARKFIKNKQNNYDEKQEQSKIGEAKQEQHNHLYSGISNERDRQFSNQQSPIKKGQFNASGLRQEDERSHEKGSSIKSASGFQNKQN